MNERIRELVRESHIDVYGLGKDKDKWEAALDRYTEAVIRECCIALNPMLRDMISRGQGREIILEHWDIDPKEISMLMLDRAIDQCKQELAEKKNEQTS